MTNCPNATKVEGQEYVDEYSIKVSLYTTEEFDNTTYVDCLTGEEGEKNFYASSRVVAKEELKEEVLMDNGKNLL